MLDICPMSLAEANEKEKMHYHSDKDDYFHCDYFYLEKLCGKFIPRCSHGYPDGHRKAHVNCGDDILNCPYVLSIADWLQNALGWKKP